MSTEPTRLSDRKIRLWNESYLGYCHLWANLKSASLEARKTTPGDKPLLLDIGCGHKPYSDLFPNWHYYGMNPTANDASPDVVGDAMQLPFASGTVDVVLCTQVLEHVPRPWLLIKECFRTLKPGGALVLSAPFYWPLHEEPHDFFRYTKHGLKHLVEDAGLELCSLKADGGDGSRLMLSLLHSLPRWISIPLRIPANLLGLALDRGLRTERLPLNYTLLARKPPAHFPPAADSN